VENHPADMGVLVSAEIVEFGPHANMTPEECLAAVSRESWTDVLVIGYREGSNELTFRSSKMNRELGLWLTEHAKLHVLGLL
jgi:hypothetical protein